MFYDTPISVSNVLQSTTGLEYIPYKNDDDSNSNGFLTLLEKNSLKMSHLNFSILAFSPFFVLLKLTCLVTLFDRKLQVFKKSPKWTILGIFNQLLSTQNVNVARFARNVE